MLTAVRKATPFVALPLDRWLGTWGISWSSHSVMPKRFPLRRVSFHLDNDDSRSQSHHADLDSVEKLVNSYSLERQRTNRRSYDDVVESGGTPRRSPIGNRPSVQSLFSQLELNDHDGISRKSLGPSQAHSYNDVRGTRSPSRDPSHADSMIGTLNSDYSSKHGISTIPKGDCGQCGKPIIGQVVIALGKMWHPEHYVCCECGSELGHRNFFERNGRAYCEEDYHNQFSPRCAGCNGPIKDRCVTALGKNFHIQCFVCAECGREFGDDGFHEKDGQTYCRRDFFRLFAPKCNGCQNPITSNFITALGTHWHPECFVCQGDDHFARLCPMSVTYFEEEEIY